MKITTYYKWEWVVKDVEVLHRETIMGLDTAFYFEDGRYYRFNYTTRCELEHYFNEIDLSSIEVSKQNFIRILKGYKVVDRAKNILELLTNRSLTMQYESKSKSINFKILKALKLI